MQVLFLIGNVQSIVSTKVVLWGWFSCLWLLSSWDAMFQDPLQKERLFFTKEKMCWCLGLGLFNLKDYVCACFVFTTQSVVLYHINTNI